MCKVRRKNLSIWFKYLWAVSEPFRILIPTCIASGIMKPFRNKFKELRALFTPNQNTVGHLEPYRTLLATKENSTAVIAQLLLRPYSIVYFIFSGRWKAYHHCSLDIKLKAIFQYQQETDCEVGLYLMFDFYMQIELWLSKNFIWINRGGGEEGLCLLYFYYLMWTP